MPNRNDPTAMTCDGTSRPPAAPFSKSSSGQLDLVEEAERRRDDALNRIAANAGEEWNQQADALLNSYLASERSQPTFLAEQFVAWAASNIQQPHDSRAWGPVIQRARRAGRIIFAGYAPANSSNRSPKCLWRARG